MQSAPAKILHALWTLGLALAWAAGPAHAESPPSFEVTEEREPCRDRDPLRRPYFGDTHIHTGRSQDASTQGTRTTPAQALAFARGAELGIQPFDSEGRALRTLQLERPLDFAVVTDHAEQIGEVHICQTEGAPGHGSLVCMMYRSFPRVAFFVMNAAYSMGGERWGFCGDDDEHCFEAAGIVWKDNQAAAEGAYDRTAACEFTSFVGYEWTASADAGKNLHRNVIFRNEHVPSLPVSVMETGNTASDLWDQLQTKCIEGTPGCNVLTIPHNSNLDGGLMFQSAAEQAAPIGKAEAARRARWEPLVEIMQHKGDSECLLGGDTTDEACGFEKLPYNNFGGRFYGGEATPFPQQYVREALKEGLALERKLGGNPFQFGIVASTDTHLGAAGLVSEKNHPGHGGAGEGAADELPTGLPDNIEFGPGGLAVLWAEENSRDSLFEAMQRREAYGTSGPRMAVRLFGGWDFPENLCGGDEFVQTGYEKGVPMGSRLPARTEDGPPRFAVWALQDPGVAGAPGLPLQRVQIIKGWLDEAGETHEQVFEVAGGKNEASVDLATCEPKGKGAQDLCEVWEDPTFSAGNPAFYYARVLENPSCRWSQHLCVAAGVDCADPSTMREGYEPCCSEEHRPVIQERAWTSPIWYAPEGQGAPAS